MRLAANTARSSNKNFGARTALSLGAANGFCFSQRFFCTHITALLFLSERTLRRDNDREYNTRRPVSPYTAVFPARCFSLFCGKRALQ